MYNKPGPTFKETHNLGKKIVIDDAYAKWL